MRVLWMVALVAACGKPTPADRVPAGSGVGAPTGSGSGSGSAIAAPVAREDFVALLVAQAKPALVGPFASLDLTRDLTIADARRSAPDLVREGGLMKDLDWFEYQGADAPGVSLRTERFGQNDSIPDTWLVGRLRAVISDSTIKAKLTTAWGAPRDVGRRSLWFDPPAHLRCVLEPAEARDAPKGANVLDCDRYVPIEELVGTDKALFGFEEGKPLLGMSEGAVKARWGRRVFDQGSRIMLPPTELGLRGTAVQIGDLKAPEKVTYFTLALSADQPTIERLLEAKFGKPRQTDSVAGDVYRTKPRVMVTGSEITVGIPPGE